MARKGKAKRFQYTPRGEDKWKAARDSGSKKSDQMFKGDDIKFFKPKVGDRAIRILPPTWDDAEHFGVDIFVHYGVGSDNGAYLCPETNFNESAREKCPICEDQKRAVRDGDTELERELRASHRVLVWMIDRDNEDQGPILWSMPFGVNQDIMAGCFDRSGEVFPVDDPENGYDIEFVREGEGMRTKYKSVRTARRESPLSDDDAQFNEWVGVAVDNALTDICTFYDADHIRTKHVGFADSQVEDDDEEEVEETPTVSKKEEVEDEPEEKPYGGLGTAHELTWDEVHLMDGDMLFEVNEKEGTGLEADDYDDLKQFADDICEKLGIVDVESGATRLQRLRARRAKKQ